MLSGPQRPEKKERKSRYFPSPSPCFFFSVHCVSVHPSSSAPKQFVCAECRRCFRCGCFCSFFRRPDTDAVTLDVVLHSGDTGIGAELFSSFSSRFDRLRRVDERPSFPLGTVGVEFPRSSNVAAMVSFSSFVFDCWIAGASGVGPCR